jgi:hypothetical protein
VRSILVTVAIPVPRRVRDPIPVTQTIPIEVFLTAFDLRAIPWLRTTLPVVPLRNGCH